MHPPACPPGRAEPPRLSGSSPDPRRVLLALNASDLGRDAICRLAACLDSWLGRGRQAAPIPGVSAEAVRRGLASIGAADRVATAEERQAGSLGASIVTRLDPEYPPALFDLELPPPVLYCRGTIPTTPGAAIVGPRNADPYGLETAEWFARELAHHGVTVVSGFARGVDAIAHRAALEIAGGTTVAVLGCGLAIDYPRQHAGLAGEIARAGCVISEFPCAASPRPWHFPVRNRIIAALASATLVVQAGPRSGALITARCALELGREVLAVPGRIFDRRCQGTNALIRDGALVALEPADVLQALALELSAATAGSPSAGDDPSSALGRRLFERLGQGAATAEQLAAAVGHPVGEVLAALLELEVDQRIARTGGARFVRVPETRGA